MDKTVTIESGTASWHYLRLCFVQKAELLMIVSSGSFDIF